MTPTQALLIAAAVVIVVLLVRIWSLKSDLHDARERAELWRSDARNYLVDSQRWAHRALVAEARLAKFTAPRERDEKGRYRAQRVAA